MCWNFTNSITFKVILNPEWEEIKAFQGGFGVGKKENRFYLNEHQELSNLLLELERQNRKTLLIGVSFALLDFVEKHPVKLKNTISTLVTAVSNAASTTIVELATTYTTNSTFTETYTTRSTERTDVRTAEDGTSAGTGTAALIYSRVHWLG